MRYNSVDPQVSAGGGGGAPGAVAEISQQPLVIQAVPLQPMEVYREQKSTCSPWRTLTITEGCGLRKL